MNFEFSDEQNMLRDQAVGFLGDRSPLSVARRILEGDEAYDTEVWRGITELGWTATTIPEQFNGIGYGHLELCVIAEELGRALTPVPFSSSVYMATEAIVQYGADAQKENWLSKLAQGQVIGCAALAESAGSLSAKSIQASVKNGKLNGSKAVVPDGDVADVAVVIAQDGGDFSLFLVDLAQPGVTRTSVRTIDPSRSHANIEFSNVEVEPLGKPGQGLELLEDLLHRAAVLFAFEQVGGAEAAMNQAREYALGRYAFGRPIAGFQAIKHKLANMYVAIQLARSNCYYGAWALSTNAPELPVAAATARVSASQAYRQCAEENIQTHGGMGFTWEFDCHLYYRRAKLLAVNLGGESDWKNRLITNIERERAA